MSGGTRVRIVAEGAEAKRLAGRLTRGGIAAAPDDGTAAEILVTVGIAPEDLGPYRARAEVLCAVGTPLAPYYAFGADEAVPPQEPEASSAGSAASTSATTCSRASRASNRKRRSSSPASAIPLTVLPPLCHASMAT